MAQVVVEVEVRVVHPDGMADQRHVLEALAEAGMAPDAGSGESPDAREVDAAVGAEQRPALEDRNGADVHVHVLVFDLEEGGVESREAFIVRVGHQKPRTPRILAPRRADPD